MNSRALLSAWLPAAGWSAFAAVAFTLACGAWGAKRDAAVFQVETEIQSSVAGRSQLYFDVGTGLSEQNSVSQPVTANQPQRLRFTLPAGSYRSLRFDPIDRVAQVTFSAPRIVTPGGTLVLELEPSQWTPNDQVARFEPGARALLVARTDANDPYVTRTFSPPLQLELSTGQRWWEARGRLLLLAVLSWTVLFAAIGAWHTRDKLAVLGTGNPRSAILAVASFAAVVATYPVGFAGKSFVSPNIAPLLRQSLPTIPGPHDLTQTDLRTPDPAVMMWQNVPYSMVQHEAVFEHGELPLWNRYASAGVPLLGQGQSMLGDPVHLLVIAAKGAAWAWDVKFVLARVLFAAGLALVVWTVTRSLSAALLTALAAPFVGFFNFRFNHPAVFSFAYSPWILLGWADWISRAGDAAGSTGRWLAAARAHLRLRRPAIVTLTVANIAVLGSGTVKEAYALLLVLNAVGLLAWAISPAVRAGDKPRDALLLGVLGTTILLLSAPLWLTFFSALRDAATAYERPVVWQAPGWFLIGLLDSLFFVELHAKHWGYLGAANLVFALGGLLSLVPLVMGGQLPPLQRRLALALMSGFVAGVALAFGWVPADWISAVPLLRNIYHVHNTFSVPAVVLWCAFGGLGLHWIAREGRWPWVLGGGAVAVLLLVIYFRGQPESWRTGEGLLAWATGIASHRFFLLNLVLGAGAGAVLWAYLRTSGRDQTPAYLVVAAVAALVILLYRHGLHRPLGFGETYLVQPMTRADLKAPSAAMWAARADAAGEPFRLIGTDLNVVNGWNAVYGVEGINGPDALMNRHYRELAEAVGLVPPGDWRIGFNHDALTTHTAWLDLTGVRYVASDRPLDLPAPTKVGDFELTVHRRDTAWPRAYFVPAATTYTSPGELIDQVRSRRMPFASWDESDPAARAALAPFTAPAPQPGAISATDYRLTANTTTFRVRAPTAGIVVLQETWSRGDFEVTLNGAAVPYVRVNHAFKAITVPAAGEYLVRFAYWPRHLTLALWLSAAGIVGWLCLLLGSRSTRDERAT